MTMILSLASQLGIFSFIVSVVFIFFFATNLRFLLPQLQSVPSGAFQSSRCCSPVLQLPAGPLARCGSGRVRLYRWEA